ncbi:hypothetical protein RR46_01588 [Papilio xuthus]|uniref:Lipid-binding serum glycoprotein C-terminal domain-containing protein n=1 Tax=Papilio xuthus TaxID=66420 RepID=A0A0N0PAA5_PAPXU|nr:hypothetical protein RR46_01588 [Papilio xuthus]
MEAGHMGMKPVDPAIINSVVVAMPEQGVSILLRNINVTGAKWTKLADRILKPFGTKSSVKFLSDLHVTGELTMSMAQLTTPFLATITMDMQDVESNITYTLSGQSNFNNDDYFIIGPERIAVRNSRIPTFFLQPDTEDTRIIELVLQTNQSILDHLANEVVVALMRNRLGQDFCGAPFLDVGGNLPKIAILGETAVAPLYLTLESVAPLMPGVLGGCPTRSYPNTTTG